MKTKILLIILLIVGSLSLVMYGIMIGEVSCGKERSSLLMLVILLIGAFAPTIGVSISFNHNNETDKF
jgi:hypothetical protein